MGNSFNIFLFTIILLGLITTGIAGCDNDHYSSTIAATEEPGGDSPNGDSEDTSVSTGLITDYLGIIHDREVQLLEDDDWAISQKAASIGLTCSSYHVGEYKQNFENHTSNFTYDCLNYIFQLESQYSIDKTAVIGLLEGYRQTDLVYMDQFTTTHRLFRIGCEDLNLQPTLDNLSQIINNIYDNALSEIDS